MGAYINSTKQTKEEFLSKNGVEITIEEFKNFDYDNKKALPVCLVDNGPFTAAAIAYSKRENQAFINVDDFRPKKFYLVDVEKLWDVSDLKIYRDK